MIEQFVVDTSIVMAWCFKDENDDHEAYLFDIKMQN